MSDLDITQQVADDLIAMEKIRGCEDSFNYPSQGGALRVPLFSADKREEFFLDIYRGKIALNKISYQNRARKAVILLRLDIDGAPHRNPDGEEIPCPHFHTFKEGFGDKFAFQIPDSFTNLSDLWQTLLEFMDYCNIIEKPNIERDLFI